MVVNLQEVSFNLPDAEILYIPSFFGKKNADILFNTILKETAWRQDTIKLFGKMHDVPRLQAFYGDIGCSYSYSNIRLNTNKWTSTLLKVKKDVESYTQHHFTNVLINLYRNGKDSNGWHADDEVSLGENPVIASVSLGAVRSFHIKNKKEKSIKQKIDLEHGSLLLMKGRTQHFYNHQLAKTSKKVDKRINLTFRKIVS